MPKKYEYKCNVCGIVKPRTRLYVKKTIFTTFGSNPRVIRSRTISWLCGSCVKGDPDYNRPENEFAESRTI